MDGSVARLTVVCAVLLLAACGGGGGGSAGTTDGGGSGNNSPPPAASSYTVGGTLAGLATSETVTLSDNGTDSLTVAASGSFTFAKSVSRGGSYAITVITQPADQSCVVSNGTGSEVSANVTTVRVTCQSVQYAYVTSASDQAVYQYSIAPSGVLTPLSPPSVPTGKEPRSVTIDPSGRYVYVTNTDDNTISQFVIQQDGTLAPNSPATVATRGLPVTLQFDAHGRYAYVVDAGNLSVSQYSLGANGTLAALAVAPVATDVGPWNLTLTPDGQYAYVANSGIVPDAPPNSTISLGQTVSQYAIAPDTGALSPLNPPTFATSGGLPRGTAVDATSTYAYVTSMGGDSVLQYHIGPGGALTPLFLPSAPAGHEPIAMVVHPNNKYAYVVNFVGSFTDQTVPGTISQYHVGAAGDLQPMTTPSVPAGTYPDWLTLDSSGQFLYALNEADGTISEYAIGTDGALTSLGVVPVGKGAQGMATTKVGP